MKSLRVWSELVPTYTGGDVAWASGTPLGSKEARVALPCADSVKLVRVADGAVLCSATTGDEETVTSVAVSPDGRQLFFASRATTMTHADVGDAVDAFEERERNGGVQAGGFGTSTEGRGEEEGEGGAGVVEAKVVRRWRGHDLPVLSMACDASGTLLASAGGDRIIKVWDIEGGYVTHVFRGITGRPVELLFHPDAKRLQLYVGDDEGEIGVWDLVSKQKKATLSKGHQSAITGLSVTHDGWTLATSSRDKCVCTWNLRSGKLSGTVPVMEVLEGVACMNAGLYGGSEGEACFVVAGEHGRLRCFAASGTGQLLWEQKVGEGLGDSAGGYRRLVGSSTDGALLVVAGDNSLLQFVPRDATPEPSNVGSSSKRRKKASPTVAISSGPVAPTLTQHLVGSNDEVIDVKFCCGGQALAVATNSEQLRVFDVRTKRVVALTGHKDAVLSVDASANPDGGPSKGGGRVLATGSKDGLVHIWVVSDDSHSGKLVMKAEGHVGAVGAVALSRGRRNRAFCVSGSKDLTLKLWDLGALPLASQEGIDAAVQGLGEGATLPASTVATVKAHEKDINGVAVSPNDSMVASCSQDKLIKLWSGDDLRPIRTLKGHRRGVWCISFSTVDQLLCSGSADKTVRVWNVRDGTCVRTFEGHTSSVLRTIFAGDGSAVVSSGGDGLLRLWSVRSGECVSTFDRHDDKVWALAGDGGGCDPRAVVGDNLPEGARRKWYWRLASGAADGNIRFWVDVTEEEEAAERARRAEIIEQEQELSNALRAKAYNKAIEIGFRLDQPRMLLKVFTECIEGAEDMTGPDGLGTLELELREAAVEKMLIAIVQSFSDDQLGKCLRYIRDWNTNSRHVSVAQRVLRSIFRAKELRELKKLPGIGDVFEGILAYSERHMQRADRIVQQTYILDYALTRMNIILPLDAPDASGNPLGNREVTMHAPQLSVNGTGRLASNKNHPVVSVSAHEDADTLPPLPAFNSENQAFRAKKKAKRAKK